MGTSGHQTGNMGHIHHQIGADFVCNLTELGKVDGAGIGAGTGNDHPGLAGLGGFQNFFIVDGLRFVIQTVGDDVEVFAGDIHRTAVGQMTAVCQIHAQNRVAGIYQSEESGQVGVGARVGLNIGVIAAKQLTGPLAGNLLCNIHRIAATIIALSGIAFRVFVGQTSAHCEHHGFTDDIFRCNQFDIAALARVFLADRGPYLRVQ